MSEEDLHAPRSTLDHEEPMAANPVDWLAGEFFSWIITLWILAAFLTQLWQGLPVLVVVLVGRFLTSSSGGRGGGRAGRSCTGRRCRPRTHAAQLPSLCLGRNDVVLSVLLLHRRRVLDGTIQVFQLDAHMVSIIIFSSLWGIGFQEWKGAGRRSGQLLAAA